MSNENMYDLCCRYHGKTVRICGRDGRVHIGEITRVDRQNVWLRPNRRGFGYGFGGYGYGGYGGYGYPFALGAIAGIALAGAFFW